MHKGTGQGHTLLLTAGKFIGKCVPSVEQSNGVKHCLGLFIGFQTRDVVKLERQTDIFTHRQGRDQVEELEDEADAGASKKSAIPFRQAGQILSVDPDVTAVRSVNAADQVEQGAFAAAAPAQDGGDLARLEFRMGVLQDKPAQITFVVGFGQVMESEKCIHGCDCIMQSLEEHQSSTDMSGGLYLLSYNHPMFSFAFPPWVISLLSLILLASCGTQVVPSAQLKVPEVSIINEDLQPGFVVADGSRPLIFPVDFGAHPDFKTEWWYYTGNLQTQEGRRFGFELTIFRVGLLPPTVDLPSDSEWYGRSVYFAHFAVSDIERERFYAFERYSRPGPGLAGALGDPYRVWLEDWMIMEDAAGVYRLQAAQEGIKLDLSLTDEMGIILHGEDGYSRKGESISNASYYYSQPRLRAEGRIQVDGSEHRVSGWAWKDHEFSSGVLDEDQIGWDWFSLQFDDGSALMLFQLRERDGEISASSSGTFISANRVVEPIPNSGFEITVLDEWRSPHTQGMYPSAWRIRLNHPGCVLEVEPWMADQEIHFPAVTYWEGAVHFEGICDYAPVSGNGYVELTGYAGNLPLP